MAAFDGEQLGPEALLHLVGDVYEGALEAAPWSSFAERLRTVLGARNVAITLHHAEGPIFDTYVMAAEPGDDTDWDEVEAVYRRRFMRLDPRRLELVAPGEILDLPCCAKCAVPYGTGRYRRCRREFARQEQRQALEPER